MIDKNLNTSYDSETMVYLHARQFLFLLLWTSSQIRLLMVISVLLCNGCKYWHAKLFPLPFHAGLIVAIDRWINTDFGSHLSGIYRINILINWNVHVGPFTSHPKKIKLLTQCSGNQWACDYYRINNFLCVFYVVIWGQKCILKNRTPGCIGADTVVIFFLVVTTFIACFS